MADSLNEKNQALKPESNNSIDMGAGKVSAALLKLAVPNMFSMFFQNLYALMDSVFVSWLGSVPLAAMSLSVPIYFIALSLSKSISSGSTALAANYRGSGDGIKSEKTITAAYPLIILALLPFFVLLFKQPCDYLFALLGANGIISIEAYKYSFWLILCFPFMTYTILCEAVFMVNGNSMFPMKAAIIGNIINFILNPLFLFKLKFGIAGSSMATMAGFIISSAYLHYKLKKSGFTVPSLTFKKEFTGLWKNIIKISSVIFLSLIVIPVSYAILNKFLAPFGPAAVGAFNLMGRVEMMIMLPIVGLSTALMPFIGYNYGMKNYQRIKEAVFTALILCWSVSIIFMIFFMFFPREIMGIFRPGADVLEISAYALYAAATSYLLAPCEIILNGFAQGIKKPYYCLFAIMFRVLILRTLFACIFERYYALKGILWSHPVSIMIACSLSLALIFRLLNQTKDQFALTGK